ncbi:DUF1648 domain-containing protein [Daejeonella sp.]|uniref:DUF1648 domain-containing protein n=1 Tax=Daejeonella sp. TaxID=2805397 RepID=UPI0030C0E713
MNTPRPKIKIELTAFDIALETLGWLALLAFWILVLANYPNLPDNIPTHFNGSGQPDRYGAKGNIFTLTIVASMLFLFMTLLNRMPHVFNYLVEITTENALRQYTNATKMMRFLKVTIVLIFGLISFETIQSSMGESEELTFWFLPLTLGMIFIPIAFFIIKSIKIK